MIPVNAFPSRHQTFAALLRSLATRWCAVTFVVLIVLPTTAPFQTVTLSDLFGQRLSSSAATAPDIPLVSTSRDAAVSIVPPVDHTESRLRVDSHASADTSVRAWFELPYAPLSPDDTHSVVPSQQSTILRV